MSQQENRNAFRRRLECLVSHIKCRIGMHTWITPEAECGDETHKRWGVRRCQECGRDETLMVGTGTAEWICHEEVLKKVIKRLGG